MDIEVFFSIYRDLAVGDLEQARYSNCGRCLASPYLLV